MERTKIFLIIVALLIIFIALGFYIYKQRAPGEKEALETEPTVTAEPTETSEKTQQKNVWMFGRSVMAGWFEYWGSDVQTPAKRKGYVLEYKGLYEPPDIASSFEEYINDLSANEKPVAFFKFCFVDFHGGSKEEANNNLKENKKYIEEVYRIAKNKGLKLIIGNALPRVAAETDSYLKWNHKQYNKWLLELEKKYPEDIIIFDFYNNLVDNSGNLKERFAVDKYDSHLNREAYDVLDKDFFELLEKNF
ncbi:MAG: hypothetical protein PHI88_03015 [Candidatus Pacebacteria bacterium]|jgi:hypothetical protein|nr:hypothetical protein [Candidatus Paceibacterota bacterium]